jgi:hypothetical protein
MENKTREDFIQELVNKWTREQMIKYITDHNDDTLKMLVEDRLNWDFTDCETAEDIKARGDMDYLNDPLKEQDNEK